MYVNMNIEKVESPPSMGRNL